MKELLDLLNASRPGDALREMHASGSLASVLPEVYRLFGVPQKAEHHPEVDTGVHVAMCLDMAQRLGASHAVKFSVLLHDLGKGLTPESEWPAHVDHEIRGLDPVRAVCGRLDVPAYWRTLALLVCEFHLHAHRAFEMRSKSLLKLLSSSGLEADLTLLDDFLTACEADKRGRLGKTEASYLQGDFIRLAALSLQGVPMPPGTPILGREAQELHQLRLNAVRAAGLPFRAALEIAKAPRIAC
jgi:tRNA nucleotidyltransferase (CCA-adding enzyme)